MEREQNWLEWKEKGCPDIIWKDDYYRFMKKELKIRDKETIKSELDSSMLIRLLEKQHLYKKKKDKLSEAEKILAIWTDLSLNYFYRNRKKSSRSRNEGSTNTAKHTQSSQLSKGLKTQTSSAVQSKASYLTLSSNMSSTNCWPRVLGSIFPCYKLG